MSDTVFNGIAVEHKMLAVRLGESRRPEEVSVALVVVNRHRTVCR